MPAYQHLRSSKIMAADDKNDTTSQIRYKNIVTVLQEMCIGSNPDQSRTFQFHEIVQRTGKDDREVQRALFILEGHKFVTPLPKGDFTSKNWAVTPIGIRVLSTLKDSTVLL